MFNLELEWDRSAKISTQDSEHILRVRIKPTDKAIKTLPLQLGIALDTSQSMEGEKLETAKLACQIIVNQLRQEDQFTLISFSHQVQSLLEKISGDNRGIEQSLEKLKAESITRTDLALAQLANILPDLPQTARVAILITDGHPTNSQGYQLENLEPLIEQAKNLAEQGIILCTVGLGNAANFNTEFLVNLANNGKGAFLYADTPSELIPQLEQRLRVSQAIAIDKVELKLQPKSGVKIKGYCQYRPEYLPLEETTFNQLTLSAIRSSTPTDVLLAVKIPALPTEKNQETEEILSVELTGENLKPIKKAIAIKYTTSYSEAQQINEQVNQDRLCWTINQCSTELIQTQDPHRTGELLIDLQVAATKSGHHHLASQAAQQYEELDKTGQLDAHSSTKLYQATKKIGELEDLWV